MFITQNVLICGKGFTTIIFGSGVHYLLFFFSAWPLPRIIPHFCMIAEHTLYLAKISSHKGRSGFPLENAPPPPLKIPQVRYFRPTMDWDFNIKLSPKRLSAWHYAFPMCTMIHESKLKQFVPIKKCAQTSLCRNSPRSTHVFFLPFYTSLVMIVPKRVHTFHDYRSHKLLKCTHLSWLQIPNAPSNDCADTCDSVEQRYFYNSLHILHGHSLTNYKRKCMLPTRGTAEQKTSWAAWVWSLSLQEL